MKTTLMTMVFLLGSINAFALPPKNVPNQFQLSEEKCKDLVTRDKRLFDDLSGIEMQKIDAPKDTILYFSNASMVTHQRMSKVCSSKKDNATLADLMSEQASCVERCDATKLFFKTKDSQDRAKKAEDTCKNICDLSAMRLRAIGEGIGMALKEMPAGDCTGVVSNKGRDIDVKTFNIEDKKNQRIRDTTAAER